MDQDVTGQMYLYHRYDGAIVMDRADSTAHLEQALAGDPKFTRAYVAGAWKPMSAQEVEGSAKAGGLKMSTTTRPALPAYVAPPPKRLSPSPRYLAALAGNGKVKAPAKGA